MKIMRPLMKIEIPEEAYQELFLFMVDWIRKHNLTSEVYTAALAHLLHLRIESIKEER